MSERDVGDSDVDVVGHDGKGQETSAQCFLTPTTMLLLGLSVKDFLLFIFIFIPYKILFFLLRPSVFFDLDLAVHCRGYPLSSSQLEESPIERPFWQSATFLWLLFVHRCLLFLFFWTAWCRFTPNVNLPATTAWLSLQWHTHTFIAFLLRSPLYLAQLCWTLLLIAPHYYFLQLAYSQLRNALGLCTLTHDHLRRLHTARRDAPTRVFRKAHKEYKNPIQMQYIFTHTFRRPRELAFSIHNLRDAFARGDIILKDPKNTLSALVAGKVVVEGIEIRPYLWFGPDAWKTLGLLRRGVINFSAAKLDSFFPNTHQRPSNPEKTPNGTPEPHQTLDGVPLAQIRTAVRTFASSIPPGASHQYHLAFTARGPALPLWPFDPLFSVASAPLGQRTDFRDAWSQLKKGRLGPLENAYTTDGDGDGDVGLDRARESYAPLLMTHNRVLNVLSREFPHLKFELRDVSQAYAERLIDEAVPGLEQIVENLVPLHADGSEDELEWMRETICGFWDDLKSALCDQQIRVWMWAVQRVEARALQMRRRSCSPNISSFFLCKNRRLQVIDYPPS
ncbi:hypothetical protein EIP91_009158 [Steccherinum ochraceum]|uniref:Uncharacterized protein n=1 Tax=Steccherinum ochraceum TaxID=92696 RepID=A0A4V2MV45_9APHY|nr:hypothetical protein EIP91_009158 [Steccherinum ochraceum]